MIKLNTSIEELEKYVNDKKKEMIDNDIEQLNSMAILFDNKYPLNVSLYVYKGLDEFSVSIGFDPIHQSLDYPLEGDIKLEDNDLVYHFTGWLPLPLEQETITNGDRIRSMNDEELADIIVNGFDMMCNECINDNYCSDGGNPSCKDGAIAYLKAPYNGGL